MARTMGISVPGDVSITGFDDIEIAEIVTPALTTVHVPHRDMGRRAAGMLIGMMRDDETPESVKLPTDIRLRRSLGKV
jgi:LacI family transcriptional regulator